jgi:hypothetical protein
MRSSEQIPASFGILPDVGKKISRGESATTTLKWNHGRRGSGWVALLLLIIACLRDGEASQFELMHPAPYLSRLCRVAILLQCFGAARVIKSGGVRAACGELSRGWKGPTLSRQCAI